MPPKKGRGKGKRKGKRKGKKGKLKAPPPEPELQPWLRHAPPPSLDAGAELPLPCRAGNVLVFELEPFLVLAHSNGAYFVVESGEPFGQFCYRTSDSFGWHEVSNTGEQRRAQDDHWPSLERIRQELSAAATDAAEITRRQKELELALKPRKKGKGKGKGKGKKGKKGKGKKKKASGTQDPPVDVAPEVAVPLPRWVCGKEHYSAENHDVDTMTLSLTTAPSPGYLGGRVMHDDGDGASAVPAIATITAVDVTRRTITLSEPTTALIATGHKLMVTTRRNEPLPAGWWGHGVHVLKGHPSNWALGWHGGDLGMVELVHSDELLNSQYRLTISAAGGVIFTGSQGGDSTMLLPMPAHEMIALSQAAGTTDAVHAMRALARFRAWDSLRPILQEHQALAPPRKNPFSTAEAPVPPGLTRATGADERTALCALVRRALCRGDGGGPSANGPPQAKRSALMSDSVMMMQMLAFTDPVEHQRKMVLSAFLRWWEFRCDSRRAKRATLLHMLLDGNAPQDVVGAAANVAKTLKPALVDARVRDMLGRLLLPACCGDWVLLTCKDELPDHTATPNLLLVHRKTQLQLAFRPDSHGRFDARLGPDSWASTPAGGAWTFSPDGRRRASTSMPRIGSAGFDTHFLQAEIDATNLSLGAPRELAQGEIEEWGRWRLRRQPEAAHVQLQLWNASGAPSVWLSRDGTATFTTVDRQGVVIA